LARLFTLFDIRRRPDCVKRPVQAKPRVDIARKFIGLGDDRLKRRSNESIAMSLAAGKGASIAAQEWQVRSKFLTKRHLGIFSSNSNLRRL
jgi:transposase